MHLDLILCLFLMGLTLWALVRGVSQRYALALRAWRIEQGLEESEVDTEEEDG